MSNFKQKALVFVAPIAGVVMTFGSALYARAATGTIEAADLTPVVEGGIDTLKDTLLAFLPIILPVAIVLAIFFGAYYWVKHAGHRR